MAPFKGPLDFREMREMLRAMQAGELTVSRGIEILEMWQAGNWNDDMLPPVRQDLIEEDSMPVEIIDRLRLQLAELAKQEPVAIVGELSEPTRSEVIAKGHPIGRYLYTFPIPPAVPEGWKLVPDICTEAMKEAAWEVVEESEINNIDFADLHAIYCTMLAAAPTPKEES